MLRIYNKINLTLATALIVFGCGSDDGSGNQSPEAAALTSPADQAQGLEVENLSLQWQQAADPDGDAVLYDVFLDSINPPAEMIASELNTTAYGISAPLDFDTTYHWGITAKDSKGGVSQSEVAMFTTREAKADELIVGKWFLSGVLLGGVPQTLTDCNKTSFFEFSNGVLTVEFYSENPCVGSTTLLNYSIPDPTTILVDNGNDTSTIPIVSISETELVLILDGVNQYSFIKEN